MGPVTDVSWPSTLPARLCHTALVVFHETFWVLTGTAAPVIALAGVVSLNEVAAAARLLGDSMDLARSQPDDAADRAHLKRYLSAAGPRLGVAFVLQLLNIGIQAALLALALLSINSQANELPAVVAVGAAVLGVAILAAVVFLTAQATTILEKMRSEIANRVSFVGRASSADGLGAHPSGSEPAD